MSDTAKPKAPLVLSFSCPIKWESMEGDNLVRNCDHCACKVQNISGYSQAQIDEILLRVDAGEPICVSFKIPNSTSFANIPSNRPGGERYTEERAWHTDRIETALPSIRTSLCPPDLTRWSIALATSISLIYLSPSVYRAAYAQGPQAGLKTQPRSKVPGLCSSQTVQTRTGLSADQINLSPDEYGLIAGRPAPSIVRDLVNEIVYFRGSFINAMTFPQHATFTQEIKLGQISEKKLEELAHTYRTFGPPAQARKCYSLLLALADREQASPIQVQSWREQVRQLAPKEFEEEIHEFDKLCDQNKLEQAVDHLISANKVRRLDPALEKSLLWSDISKRMDLLQSQYHAVDNDYVLETAFALSRDEKVTPELRQWVQGKRSLALRRYSDLISRADKAAAGQRYRDELDLLSRALSVGSLDPELGKLCDWPRLHNKLISLCPSLDPSSRPWCQNLASRAAHIEQSQSEKDGKTKAERRGSAL